MTPGTLWFVIFLLLVVGALAGIFLYGWKRRKEKMPDVPPLTQKDDDEWK